MFFLCYVLILEILATLVRYETYRKERYCHNLIIGKDMKIYLQSLVTLY